MSCKHIRIHMFSTRFCLLCVGFGCVKVSMCVCVCAYAYLYEHFALLTHRVCECVFVYYMSYMEYDAVTDPIQYEKIFSILTSIPSIHR